jgi:Fic family protein
MFESLTISRIFIKAPAQYARAFLYTEIDEFDLTYFVSFNIKVIKIAIKKLIEYIKSKQVEIKDITQHLQKYPELNHRQRELLKHSLDNPDAQYTVQEYKTINSITYETARRDLLYLAEKKLLIKAKKGKKFYFMPTHNLSSRIKTKK